MDEPINVLVLVDFSDATLNRLKGLSPRLKITKLAARAANDVPREIWATTEILYTHRPLPEPEQALKLRWIQLHFAGVDSIIEAPIFQNEGIILTSASGIHASTIAEFSFAMILAHARKIPLMLKSQRNAEWLKIALSFLCRVNCVVLPWVLLGMAASGAQRHAWVKPLG